MFHNNKQEGFVLVSTLLMMTLLMALVSAYAVTSRTELAINKRSGYSNTGFYTAEAGLNLRAEEIRQIFVGYNRPEGTSPLTENACEGGNVGSDDFECETFEIGNHDAVTYVNEDPSNPNIITIPPGERYQNLNAQEYLYTVTSLAKGPDDKVEAFLELSFKSRLVPMFQFVAFYNKDLEILPGPAMNLSGPIHTNGDLYLNANSQLNISGQVTTSGVLFRGRKNDSSCKSQPVRIIDPVNLIELINPCPGRTEVKESDITAYNGMVQMNVEQVTVPEPEHLDPDPSQIYFNKADLRLALNLTATGSVDTSNSPTGVEVRDSSNALISNHTNTLAACGGVISGNAVDETNTFYNNREGSNIRMLEIDMQGLLDCINVNNILSSGNGLDDDTEGGLVFHFTVEGPNSSAQQSNYGVRIRNGAELQASGAGPNVQGITVVSDQAVYISGNYNSVNKIPAAVLTDAFNVLSNNWNFDDVASSQSLSSRVASTTTINAAVLAGTDTTGGVEGAGGQGGGYNGGLENYPRFHENWSGRTLNYRGSFVSLNNSLHSDGAWSYGSPQYTAPGRNWDYDTDFNNAENLPPLTPRFVYLRQQLFVRKYEVE